MFSAASAAVLSSFAYDAYKCSQLHKDALRRASEIGDRPLGAADSSSKATLPKVHIFYTAKSIYQNLAILSNFRKYVGKYLANAGIDCELRKVVLLQSLYKDSMNLAEGAEKVVEKCYESKENFTFITSQSTSQILQAFLRDVEAVQQDASAHICTLNRKDSVWLQNAAVLPCDENYPLFTRIVRSFFKRRQLEDMIKETFALIETVTK